MLDEVSVIEIKGEKYALLPYSSYEKLIEDYEDQQDIQAVIDFRKKLADGKENLTPSCLVQAILIDRKNKVKVCREYRNMTQEELAAKTGVTLDYIQKLERGDRDCSFKMAVKIAEVLEISRDLLI